MPESSTRAARSPSKQALLAQRLRQAATAELTITPRPDGTVPPLSSSQERLWFVEQLAHGSGAYAIVLGYRLRGELDTDSLEGALDYAAARHEAMRMRFPAARSGQPSLVVDEPAPAGLSITDLTTTRLDAAGRADRARQLVAEQAAQPFDLAAGPIVRRLLIRISPDDHVLALVIHHIVADGWSVGLLIGEIIDAYVALRAGREPRHPELPVQFGDYAVWERARLAEPEGGRELAYWREQLAGVPPLDLAIAGPRPAEQRYAGASHEFRLDAALTAGLTELATRYGATMYMVLMAGLQAVLARYSGECDFAIGSGIAGRPYRELEGVFGSFVNTLPIRARLGDDPGFAAMVSRCRDTMLDAMSHQDVPFDRIVSDLNLTRDPGRSPVYQVVYSQSDVAAPAAPDRLAAAGTGLEITHFPVELAVTYHDLVLYTAAAPDGVNCLFTYRTDLFEPAAIARLAGSMQAMLAAAAADPGLRLSELPRLSPADRDVVLGPWSGAAPGRPAPVTLAALTQAQAARTPHAPAVTAGGRSLTHAELDGQSSRLARRLRRAGVGPETPVAIALPASPEAAAAVLAVLKAGGCYLPVDPEQPPGRLAYILADAGAAVLIGDTGLPDLPGYAGQRLDIGAELAAAAGESDAPLPPAARPEHLAYIIYTSGTTGRPKGVGVDHAGVTRYLRDISEILGVEPGAQFALAQSLAFDFAILMFWLPLITGGCLHLLPGRISADELADAIAGAGIDYLKMTPSHLIALTADSDIAPLLPARALVLAGEAAPADWARSVAGQRRCAVFNSYGPTETVVAVTTHRLGPDDPPPAGAAAPIGRPLPGVRALVLDDRLEPVPPGMAGELYIGGSRIARGYLGQPGLTAERFVASPFDGAGTRLYRTGDRARWLDDGVLEFLGRTDHQVKVRGYRIELAEVEAALARLPGVAAAVADLRGPAGREALVGYLDRAGAAEGTDVSPDDLRDRLAQWLPDYMIPGHFVPVDGLPRQAQGKVDRQALPDPDADLAAGRQFVAPRDETEEMIAGIWAAVLELDQVGVHDSFFDLGGHSLLATRVVARLRRKLAGTGATITVVDMFKAPTVAGLAALVAERQDQPEPAGPRLVHELTPKLAAGQRRLSVVCAPYGGASAAVFAQLAAAMPAGVSLYAIEVPGRDIGQPADLQPVTQVAQDCVAEIRRLVSGPLVIYGHCGPGGALAVEIAQQLDAAGREIDALYLGGVFPFARPTGRLLGPLSRLTEMDRLRGDRLHANWLRGMGSDIADLDADQVRFTIRAMREDGRLAEAYFTDLLGRGARKLRAPVISVVGERDPGGWFFQERYREWDFLSDSVSAVVLSEAGHFFVQHRAAELAQILTSTHPALAQGHADRLAREARGLDATWWLYAHADPPEAEPDAAEPARAEPAAAEPPPGLRRFMAVALGQLVSITGSTLTEFALPLWIYTTTGSLARFGLLAVLGLLPGIVVAPLAGAVTDRYSRRRVMLAGDIASGGAEAVLLALYLAGALASWEIYALIAVLSVALSFQRTAYMSAIPQLVPKRYLGHANGMFQTAMGLAQFIAPLIGVALLAAIGLSGILTFDVASYVVAIGVVAVVRFPAAMGLERAESVLAEIRQGLRFTLAQPSFRTMIIYFAALNLFLSPLFVLLSPLVLSFSRLPDVALVAAVAGVGGVAAGLILTVWGGPPVRRMRGIRLTALALGVTAVLTGLRPSLLLVCVGAFGIAFCIGTANGIIMTIIQTKVPQRIQGRVFALNAMIAAIAVPVGFGIIAPYGTRAVTPLTRLHGPAGEVIRAVVGTGPGRGIGLLYVCCGLVLALLSLLAGRLPRLARFDTEVPDAMPDDLLGLQAARAAGSAPVPAADPAPAPVPAPARSS